MEKLLRAYQEQTLVPFIGAGVSVPFRIPDWGGLITQIARTDEQYDVFQADLQKKLEQNDFCSAISYIKEHSAGIKRDEQIHTRVCAILQEKMQELERKRFDVDNSYLDLLKFQFKNYFTFNYDTILESISAMKGKDLHTKFLEEESLDTQFLQNRQTQDATVWHVHGAIPRQETIVLSAESYEKRYTNERYCKNLEFWINSHVFLFIGVSFRDVFVRELFQRNKNIFYKNGHYILLPETEAQDSDCWMLKYGVKVIPYSVQNGYVAGIRECLDRVLGKECVYKKSKDKKVSVHKTELNVNAKNAPIMSGDYQNNTLYFN